MIENKHLKIIQALHLNGTLTEAANTLYLSQSALSHQISYLENKLDTKLWEREGRNLRLTQAGKLLLQTAEQVLPVIKQTEETLKAYSEGRQGILRIGVECYPCYEWLTGVIGVFLEKMPEVDIDIVNKFQFSGLEGLLNQHIDMLVTPDMEIRDKVHYETIAEYELVLLVAKDHPLANHKIVSPTELAKETLLSFPVPLERLDIITEFLNPASLKPSKMKQIESIELMLQMTALDRGVCALPQWLAEESTRKYPLQTLQIGENSIHKKLYIALRSNDTEISYIQKFIGIGKDMANQKLEGINN
ncbi:LysR substrate-binding domain-containing protein [Cocleimonas flava]|uniref:LysR family transcriptional regulator for metE and metH n=1 Tax=Cocleimonas flava TaxID=634765 RepID=A0A4R1EVW6_9GAMM|nr:LysR family transcriptional regulator [Cocleimonas flava]TCJ84890.1 LysR family transcriptional regulator for metE and metH [Cocleimonas flava]